ncbi:nucleotidyltransferase domain-containing protein [Geotalea uraniireducens]|uniref:Nucleotidyltransferase family protein n=1 Tax=Geotalea uraniireducens (strain Rf4) TaxID=351605 RepID=A5G508_GEOUR|nr:nucleotidyltransferase family protein [Geotalea uraniireducens]ABQ26876.1 hypothetical protein Gura_2702 [Geotalea uraniireducens Rf4]
MADMSKPESLPSFPGHFRLSPEFRLLAACSWVAPSSLEQDQAEKIVSLCNECTDWGAFTALVNRHEVSALVYAALRKHADNRFPNNVREKLKGRSEQVRRQALLHAAELVRLIRKFAGHGIEVLPLKGVMLSLQLFGDPGMRHSRDMDLMVKLEDLDRTDRLLEAEGYRRIFPGTGMTARQRRYLVSKNYHYEYLHERLGLHLELHWRCELWTPEQSEELWGQCRPVDWMGVRIKCPAEDALLLFLSDHGARHKWMRLKWLGDVAMLLSRQRPAECDDLLAIARRLDLTLILAQTALLTHWLYGIRLSEPLLTLIIREKSAFALATEALDAMLGAEGYRFLNGLRDMRYSMCLKKTISHYTALKRLLISPTDFEEFPLPDSLFWLYYPLRPILWIKRHI